MLFYSDNPVRDFHRYDNEQERCLSRRPRCSDCGEHIQDETAVCIDGKWLCDECLDNYRRNLEDEDEDC